MSLHIEADLARDAYGSVDTSQPRCEVDPTLLEKAETLHKFVTRTRVSLCELWTSTRRKLWLRLVGVWVLLFEKLAEFSSYHFSKAVGGHHQNATEQHCTVLISLVDYKEIFQFKYKSVRFVRRTDLNIWTRVI